MTTATTSSDRLFARIRKNDDVLREHFQGIKDGDRAYEIRRLLERAILLEREENKQKS